MYVYLLVCSCMEKRHLAELKIKIKSTNVKFEV